MLRMKLEYRIYDGNREIKLKWLHDLERARPLIIISGEVS